MGMDGEGGAGPEERERRRRSSDVYSTSHYDVNWRLHLRRSLTNVDETALLALVHVSVSTKQT